MQSKVKSKYIPMLSRTSERSSIEDLKQKFLEIEQAYPDIYNEGAPPIKLEEVETFVFTLRKIRENLISLNRFDEFTSKVYVYSILLALRCGNNCRDEFAKVVTVAVKDDVLRKCKMEQIGSVAALVDRLFAFYLIGQVVVHQHLFLLTELTQHCYQSQIQLPLQLLQTIRLGNAHRFWLTYSNELSEDDKLALGSEEFKLAVQLQFVKIIKRAYFQLPLSTFCSRSGGLEPDADELQDILDGAPVEALDNGDKIVILRRLKAKRPASSS